jgi:hypothetical protein
MFRVPAVLTILALAACNGDTVDPSSSPLGEPTTTWVPQVPVVDTAWPEIDTDQGGGDTDTGVVDTDTGVVDTDTGVVDTDTGVVDTDTGVADTDTGVVDTDTGVADTDTGVVDTDTGVADTDTGVADTDTGVADTDTAVADTDTGTVSCALLFHADARQAGTSTSCTNGAACSGGDDVDVVGIVENPCSADIVFHSTTTCLANDFTVTDTNTSIGSSQSSLLCLAVPTDTNIPAGTSAEQVLNWGVIVQGQYRLDVVFDDAAASTASTTFVMNP